MTLDATARESNVRDSIKKFCIDTFDTGKGIDTIFDITLDDPPLRDKSVSRWISVHIGDMTFGKMSTIEVDFYLVTRKDPEAFRLSQLRDIVYGELVDVQQTDGMKRIAFYRSYANQAWDDIGAIVVQHIIESATMRTDENGKYKVLTVIMRFASKL